MEQNTNTGLMLSPDIKKLAIELDSIIEQVNSVPIGGFERVFIEARALEKLTEMITPEMMKPIVSLKNNPLGFRTDDTEYEEPFIKKCFIVGILSGLKPTGNHWNIIASKFYITKEGYSEKLFQLGRGGLKYRIDKTQPEEDEKHRWYVDNIISFVRNGKLIETNPTYEKFVVRTYVPKNNKMSDDALLGKAERRAKKWLYEWITGQQTSDSNLEDEVEAEVLESKTKEQPPKEKNQNIQEAETVEEEFVISDNLRRRIDSMKKSKDKTHLNDKMETILKGLTEEEKSFIIKEKEKIIIELPERPTV